MTDRIRQEITVPAPPARVYEVLTDASLFSKMSGGAPAEIEARAGGAFSMFGGMIEGRNVECAPGQRLVQAWRAKNWDPGVYSIVRFELAAQGDGTTIVLDHAGFPQGQAPHLDAGWHSNYWEPLRTLLSE